jgi:hypothetical protein
MHKFSFSFLTLQVGLALEQSACKLRLNGIKEELKHVEKERKQAAPDLKKVYCCHSCTRQQSADF